MIIGQREILEFVQDLGSASMDDLLTHFHTDDRKKICCRISKLSKFGLVEKYEKEEKIMVRAL